MFFFVNYVDFNEPWRPPTDTEATQINVILNEYAIPWTEYYVKKIDSNEYFISCLGTNSNWIIREINTDEKKMFYLREKAERKIKAPYKLKLAVPTLPEMEGFFVDDNCHDLSFSGDVSLEYEKNQ